MKIGFYITTLLIITFVLYVTKVDIKHINRKTNNAMKWIYITLLFVITSNIYDDLFNIENSGWIIKILVYFLAVLHFAAVGMIRNYLEKGKFTNKESEVK